MRHHRRQVAARRVARDRKPVGVGAQLAGVRGHPLRCGPSIFDRGGVGVFGCQPVVDRHHHRARPDRVVARIAVVGVEVADRPSAAVEEDHHRRRGLAVVGGRYTRIGIGPAGPSMVRSSVRTFGMNRPARQVAEPLPRRLDASVGCQLKRNRLQYLQQDGVDGRLLLGDGHGDTVRTPRTRLLWVAAAVVGACYGVFLIVTALRLPSGAELTGQFALQPAVKALTAVLLAVAALTHPIARERRWLVAALLFSAAGDFLLAMPWWEPSFVLGLGAFLVAHLCFLAALLPLVARSAPRLAAAAVTVVACVALLVWFWPRLIAEGMAVPVTLYIAVLGAMVCAALLARLPTPWTALGAVCFAVSDGMIGIGKFVLRQRTRGAGGADLVGICDVVDAHHGGLLLRSHV